MSRSTPLRPSVMLAVVLFSVVLLAAGSTAWASVEYYNIVTYSNSLGPDTAWYPSDGVAKISGWIETDGTTGYLAPANILAATFTIAIPGQGTFTGSATLPLQFVQGYSLYAGPLGTGTNNAGSQYGNCLYLLPGSTYGSNQFFDFISFPLSGTGTMPNGVSGIAYENYGLEGGFFDGSNIQIIDNGNPADPNPPNGNSPTPYVDSIAQYSKDHANVVDGASVPDADAYTPSGTSNGTIGEYDMIIADAGNTSGINPFVGSTPEPATMIVWSLLGAASWLGMRVWRRGRPTGRQWSEQNRQAILDIVSR